MSNYGITSAGFFPKPVTELDTEIVADQLSTIDTALDTSAENPIGQQNGIVEEKLAELWEIAQVCYNSINPDDAEGNQLDNVCALTGTLRQPPLPSFVLCNCTLAAAHSPYLAGTLVASVTGQPTIQFSNAADINVTADGLITGLPFTSIEDGPIPAVDGTLTVIATPVTGWTTITNPLTAVLGTLLELDPALRQRREEELAAAGSGTVDAISASVLEVDGGAVLNVTILENLTGTTDGNNTPGHAMQAVIWDGLGAGAANNDVAQALWNGKPAGIPYYGTSSGTAIDAAGNSQTVLFTRPTQIPIYLAFTVTFVAGLSSSGQTAAIAAVKAAAVAFSLSTPSILQPGVEVIALALKAAALGVTGIFDVPVLYLDVTASPTATANIPIGPLDVAVIQTANVKVNGS